MLNTAAWFQSLGASERVAMSATTSHPIRGYLTDEALGAYILGEVVIPAKACCL
jgi:hypothetical protein